MTKKAFKLDNGQLIDLINYTNDLLRIKDVESIIVGTDSQNKRYSTTYVTTVVYKYFGRGAHCVYHRENVKKIKDRFTRLWGEVERSIEIAQQLELPPNKGGSGIKVDCIELDFNRKELTGSNAVLKASQGYVIGMGFSCKVKPDDGLSAVRYSDHVCRR